MSNKHVAKAFSKFQKLKTLNSMQDNGGLDAYAARSEKKRMQQDWKNRKSSNTEGFHKRKHAEPSACVTVTVR